MKRVIIYCVLFYFMPCLFLSAQTNIVFGEQNIELEEVISFKKLTKLCDLNKRSPNELKRFYVDYFCNADYDTFISLFESENRVEIQDSVFKSWKSYIQDVPHTSEGYIKFRYKGNEMAALQYSTMLGDFEKRDVKLSYFVNGRWCAPSAEMMEELSKLAKFVVTLDINDLQLLADVASSRSSINEVSFLVNGEHIDGDKVINWNRISSTKRSNLPIKFHNLIQRTADGLKVFDEVYKQDIINWLDEINLDKMHQPEVLEYIKAGDYLNAAIKIDQYLLIESDVVYNYVERIKSICQ